MKKAYYRSIPAYYDEETNELRGRNWLYDKLIDISIWIDINIIKLDGFPIIVEDDSKEKNS